MSTVSLKQLVAGVQSVLCSLQLQWVIEYSTSVSCAEFVLKVNYQISSVFDKDAVCEFRLFHNRIICVSSAKVVNHLHESFVGEHILRTNIQCTL